MRKTGIKGIMIILPAMMCLFSATTTFAVVDSNSVCIVENGMAKSVIVLAESNALSLKNDVELLTQCIKKSTGAIIPVETNSTDTNNIEIHIGNTDYVQKNKINVTSLDSDGFCILFPTANKIVIVSKSEWGLRYGIFEFIEQYIGIRWLFPGELGEYVPKKETVRIQRQPVKQDPAFWSRQLSSPELSQIIQDNPIREWARRLRMHQRIEFHHNLYKLFPPSKYYNGHPDWYPSINGEKICPADGGPAEGDTWQPVFDAPGIQEESIRNIRQFFENNPGEYSISLGINDTENFGRSSTKLNSLGLPDLSDYYYDWATKVASKVLESYPDKSFGCLAYFNVADPPKNVKMNPRITPFITFDRMGWLDKKTAEKDMKRTMDWSKAAGQMGWYDYIYGDMNYKVPRIYWHIQSDYLKFANANGVRAVYAEAYPAQDWTEGPKLYIYLKLLWNPTADVNEMLNEWYTCAVGSDAAPYLKEYYQFWEQFWTQSVTKGTWFKRGISVTWLPFQDDGYISGLREADIDKCQKLLENVLEKARSEQEKARAAFFMKGFNKIKNRLGNLFETRENLSTLQGAEFKKYDFTPVEASNKRAGDLPDDWGFWSQLPKYKKAWWDKISGRTQAGSLAIDANELAGKIACFITDIPVKPSKSYRITYWFKATNFPADGLVGLVAKWKGEDEKWGEQHQSVEQYVEASNYNKWEKLCISFVVPQIQQPFVLVRLVVQNADRGVVRFDDFLIEELQGD